MLKRIGTHSGSFHCDEVMACCLLKKTFEFANATIIRTRDKSILNTLDILVDVGDEFDPTKYKYDHHQKSFQETFGGRFTQIRLSSAGLIWKYFGKEIIQNLSRFKDPNTIEILHNKMYSDLFQSLDGWDNGISQYSSEISERYREITNLSLRVNRLNPSWQDKNPDHDEYFYKAMKVVDNDFNEIFQSITNEWLPGRYHVEKALLSAKSVDLSGKIVFLNPFCQWKDHLFNLEDQYGVEKIVYVIYEDSSKSWKVQSVGVPGVNFAQRKPLPKAWRGKRQDELVGITGIEDIEFVHASGFIGGAKSYESALRMARTSLEISD